MQIRKRAKSITFGRKEKKEETEKPIVKEEETTQPKKAEEKAEVTDHKTHEKPQTEETPSASHESHEDESATETPSEEFVANAPESKTAEKKESSQSDAAEEEKQDKSDLESVSLAAKKVEALESEEPAPKENLAAKKVSEEKSHSDEESSDEPQSAFTIHKGEADDFTEEGEKRGKGIVYFFIIALLAFILGLGAIAAVSYSGMVKIDLPKMPTDIQIPFLNEEPTPTLEPTEEPTATPKPVDLQAYTVAVLNGTDISGKAAEVKTSLATAGFKVGNVGNADKTDYDKTQLQAKESVDKAYVDKLQEELEKSFMVETVTAPDNAEQDVTVILGKETAQ